MRILVISVHPDDETLGCGGTLLKHRAQGDTLYWLIVTRPHEPTWTAETIGRRERVVEQVSAFYGFEEVFHPAGDARKGLESAINSPEMIKFRENMLNGIYPAYCGELCYLKENKVHH